MHEKESNKLGVSWCCGNYCWLAFVLWCGYCSVSFQSFELRHWCPQHQETTNKLPHHHIISMLRLLSTIWLLTNQCVKNHSVMTKTHVEGQNEIQDKMVSTCVDSQFPLYLRPIITLYDHKQSGLGNKRKRESSNVKTITRTSCCLAINTYIQWHMNRSGCHTFLR